MVAGNRRLASLTTRFTVSLVLSWALAAQAERSRSPARPSLARATAQLRVPPAWWGGIDPRESYEKAIANFKVARPKYGRHLLPRRISRVQSRIDLLSLPSLRTVRLRDGSYNAGALGYNGPLTVAVRVKRGRIDAVDVKHNEKIELGSTRTIPRQIVEKQDLHVDAVTAATVTSQAIVEGALNALKRAGLNVQGGR